MTFDTLGPGTLDYQPCRYGTSKVPFRGPARNLEAPFVAFVGSTDTYGRFIEKPFPALVEAAVGRPCVNFGCPNAGIDLMMQDPALREAMERADATVLELVSPRNMSNRFYSVHPRRNDRFLQPSALLSSIYGEVDFAEFNFTKHMLRRLRKVSRDRFKGLVEELREAWLARMRLLLGYAEAPVVLLWFSDHEPGKPCERFGSDPWFVTREMIDELLCDTVRYVEVVASDGALAAGTQGMVFSELETPQAEHLLGVKAHEEAARAIAADLREVLR